MSFPLPVLLPGSGSLAAGMTQNRPTQFGFTQVSGFLFDHRPTAEAPLPSDAPPTCEEADPLPSCAPPKEIVKGDESVRRAWVASLPLSDKLALLLFAIHELNQRNGTNCVLLKELARNPATTTVPIRTRDSYVFETIPTSPILLKALHNGCDLIQEAMNLPDFFTKLYSAIK